MNTVYPRKSPRERRLALIAELYANLCRAADIIVSEHPTHDHRYKEAEGWIMNSLADARRALNAEAHGRAADRTLQPLVGSLEVDHAND